MKVDIRSQNVGQIVTVEKLTGDIVFNAAELQALSPADQPRLLTETLATLIDRLSKAEVGPQQEAARAELLRQAQEMRDAPAAEQSTTAGARATTFLSTLRGCFGEVAEIVLTAVKVIQTLTVH